LADIEASGQWMISDGPGIFERLLSLLTDRPIAGKQVQDANPVAAMLEHGVSQLVTFNAGNIQRFGDMIEIVALVRR
jgi:hypothetical protein